MITGKTKKQQNRDRDEFLQQPCKKIVFVIILLYICNIKYNEMIEPGAIKVQTAFRLNKDLIHRLKMKAKKENRSLNNYVETVLMDIAYNEPNDETIEAIEEARSGKPMEKLDVDNLEGFVAEL